MEKETGIRFKKNLVYGKKHDFKWCTLESENEKIGNFLVKRFKDKKFSDKFVKDYTEFFQNAIKELKGQNELLQKKVDSLEEQLQKK